MIRTLLLENGKRIEYKKNKLIFQGDYFNGTKWTGKGIEIYFSKDKTFILDIEYINGHKIKCEGKEYNNQNILIFEGEYYNGERNGKGKKYNDQGVLIFEGEYLNNHKIRGKEYLSKDKVKSEGEYLFDRIWNGKVYDLNGNILYELINGKGKIKEYQYNNKLLYEGQYLNGKRNGYGKEYCFDKLLFEGQYLNGKRNGYGKE